MLLKYTGPKPQKKIEYNDRVFIFAPTAEVDDKATIRFLLNADMKGLFEVAASEDPAKEPAKESAREPAENTAGEEEQAKNPAKEPVKKKRPKNKKE